MEKLWIKPPLTEAQRPKLGLAVRREAGLGKAPASVPADCRLLPAPTADEYEQGAENMKEPQVFDPLSIPGEMNSFYLRHNGIEFTAPGAGKFRSITAVTIEKIFVEGESAEERKSKSGSLAERFAPLEKSGERKMLRFFDFADGSYLVLETGHTQGRHLVRHIDGGGKRCLAVLGTFNETLERILAGGGVLPSSG